MDPIKASELSRPSFKANPYPFFARLRAEAPVCPFSVPFYGRGWLVARYDDVVTFLKDDRFSKDLSAKTPWLPPFARPLTQQMASRDPPDHTRLRTLVSKAFTPRRIEQLRGRVQDVCDELLAAVPSGGPFDIVHSYALPLPLTVFAELLGIAEADRRRFHILTRGTLPLGAPSGVLDFPLAMPYLWLLMRYFRKLFAERRARPKDDLLTALVQAEEAGDRLSEDELLGMAVILLLAGYETTVHLIGNGALALLQHPEQRERFEQEPALAESAIEELLRYTSPVEFTPPRLTREEVSLAGVTIPGGELVAGIVGSANHDEAQFAEPERLDLAREPNRHVSFGQGAHFCLGAALARLEGQIALTTLFRRLPGLRLARPGEALRWRRLLAMRGLEELPVAF